jgi:hypothetical protein
MMVVLFNAKSRRLFMTDTHFIIHHIEPAQSSIEEGIADLLELMLRMPPALSMQLLAHLVEIKRHCDAISRMFQAQ